MPDICYFEIPVDNMDRARKFYGELFGWKFEEMTLGKTAYWHIRSENGVGGGLMDRKSPDHRWMNYISVDSVKTYIEKAKKLGATVLLTETLVPAMGRMAILQDDEKNAFGLWQDDLNAK